MPRQIPISENDEIIPFMKVAEAGLAHFKSKPVMIYWAKGDIAFSPYMEDTLNAFPEAHVKLYEKANHFLQEDVGDVSFRILFSS